MSSSRLLRSARTLARLVASAILIVGLLVALTVLLIQTDWAKNQIRAFIVRQANEFLLATVEIGRLDGSLLTGLALEDIRISRDGRPLIAIDDVALSYSIRELFEPKVVLRRLVIVRPRIIAFKQPDGRWNLPALLRKNPPGTPERQVRPLLASSIEVLDGTVTFESPLTLGVVRVPHLIEKLDLAMSLDYESPSWTLKIVNAAWVAPPPELTMNQLSGVLTHGPPGWSFSNLVVKTPRSALTATGQVNQGTAPTTLDVSVSAEKFAFQEWSGALSGLSDIAIESSLETRFQGPLTALATTIALQSNGGDVRGAVTLDTTAPGWRGVGSLAVSRVDLARWFSRPERRSDITGTVDFNLDLELGRHFPRGTYLFVGPHAAYMGYAADSVRARGSITTTDALIADATAVAYGAHITALGGSTVGIDAPHGFHFRGSATGVDLRLLPTTIPVPRVESVLTFDYDASGQFDVPSLTGTAQFGASEFLGATIAAGTVGALDTSSTPVRYSGEGDINGVDTRRFGAGLDVTWLKDPKYAGTLAGHFRIDGAGSDPATMTLDGGGHLARAQMFGGTLSNAAVALHVDRGSVNGSYDGQFSAINPAVAVADTRFAASLTGTGVMRMAIRDLLMRTPRLEDYDVAGTAMLSRSQARGIDINEASATWTLADQTLRLSNAQVAGPLIEAKGSGRVELDTERSSDFTYDVSRGDLALLKTLAGWDVAGESVTAGHMTGPTEALRLTGDATVTRVEVAGAKALSTTGQYDVTLSWSDPSKLDGRVTGSSSNLIAFNQELTDVTGTITYAGHDVGVDLQVTRPAGPNGTVAGKFVLDTDRREVALSSLDIAIGRSQWRLADSNPPPVVTWDDSGLEVTSMTIESKAGADQRIGITGAWRENTQTPLHITATHVFLDTIAGLLDRPAIYGGVVDGSGTIRRTASAPVATGDITVVEGRIERLSYQQLVAHVDYRDAALVLNARLDQAPGVWLTATGSVPVESIGSSESGRPLNVSVRSSAIDLGLVEGFTTALQMVAGTVQLNVDVVGTRRDPHVTGGISMANAAFTVPATGARYTNGNITLQLSEERIVVEAFHLEDRNGRPLEIHGSLGTHELQVGELEIDITAKQFEMLHNGTGTLNVDATLKLRGRFDQPLLAGDVSVVGGSLSIDEILARQLNQPYATEATLPTPQDVGVPLPLGWWDRLALDISVHSPGTLRMTGDNVEIGNRAPIGLGSFSLRATGDLYVYKTPDIPVSVTGWLDSISGRYAFQGRRFDVDPTSSIHFLGNLDPEVYVTVNRLISGVEARVSVLGPLSQPELRLTSTPPLDPSEILSLIVFNTSTSQLSAVQQQNLAVRAGTLAAGFLVSPLVSSLERSLGLETLEVETGQLGSGTKLTVGEEIAPGLIARFSRQFGGAEYDEATIEYNLSRILRLRATFSDAGAVVAASPFRRTERAGVDLLFFFSF